MNNDLAGLEMVTLFVGHSNSMPKKAVPHAHIHLSVLHAFSSSEQLTHSVLALGLARSGFDILPFIVDHLLKSVEFSKNGLSFVTRDEPSIEACRSWALPGGKWENRPLEMTKAREAYMELCRRTPMRFAIRGPKSDWEREQLEAVHLAAGVARQEEHTWGNTDFRLAEAKLDGMGLVRELGIETIAL